jgi:mono/diheme cytochrome c family protein
MLDTMRLATILLTVFAFCLAGLMAQDELTQYQTWMKAAAGAQRAAMKGADVAATAAAAKTAADNFDSIVSFWKAKGKDDAVGFATGARDAAKAAAAATTADDQKAALAKMGPNCQGCHAVYREGSKFKGL